MVKSGETAAFVGRKSETKKPGREIPTGLFRSTGLHFSSRAAQAVPERFPLENAMPKTVYYASIGPELALFDIDVEGAALTRRSEVTLPAKVQYAWPHPSRRSLYVVSSNGGPGVAGDKHHATALAIDPTSGALRPHGAAAELPSRPIHCSIDRRGQYLLTAYNDPSNVTVHRLNADGTIGEPVAQAEKLDTGIYAHQILAAPSNRALLLVTRGNDARPDKPEDPGAIKTFAFADGVLRNLASIAPGNGLGFGPRHLDFHPAKPWVFVSVERQNKLYVYQLADDTGLTREPLFVKDSLLPSHSSGGGGKAAGMHQGAGPIHVHPNGRFVYQTNRASGVTDFNGQKVFAGGENSVAVFAVDRETGEPTLIQTIDGRGIQLRTFGIDPSGRLLVAASIMPLPVRGGDKVFTLPAGLIVFRIAGDGRLTFARKYDVETGGRQQFWSGMVTLA
jgi:6-phosphogluconolactonase (cycloisomerase 2 family)